MSNKAPRGPGAKNVKVTLKRKYLGTINFSTRTIRANVTSLPNWEDFTSENFAWIGPSVAGRDGGWTFSWSVSYNNNTGIVTGSGNLSGGSASSSVSANLYVYYYKSE